jgi:putative Holliday junction resolvase
MGRVLGFDIGDRWLGIAAGDETLRIATPRPELRLAKPEDAVDAMRQLIDKERAVAIVIGMPYTLRGESGPQAQVVERLIAALSEVTTCAIHTVDERLTSSQASEIQRSSKSIKKGQKPVREDSISATLILQTWFDRGSSGIADR